MVKYIVIEGIHTDPNDKTTLDSSTRKQHGPFESKKEAEDLAQALIQKNVDDYQHRAWVEQYIEDITALFNGA